MKMFYGKNASGNVKEAVNGLHSPQLIVFTSNVDGFEKAVADVEALFRRRQRPYPYRYG